MQITDQVQDVVKEIVGRQLEPARIVDVRIKEDVDHDGERILRVEVIFELEHGKLNPENVMGLARHLREPLRKLHEDRFPVFSFMKPSELSGAAA